MKKVLELKLVMLIAILGFASLFMSAPVLAEKVYEYQNPAPLNGRDVTRVRGCEEFVELPATGISAPDDKTVAMIKSAARSMRDPYVVTINGITYVMVRDRKDNNWSADDILGINDPKENRFASLIALNSDNNHAKLTPAELKKANVRFVRMNKDGVLLVKDRTKDFDLNKIDYIDIINLKRTANSKNTGIFGHFTVFLKTDTAKKRAVVGYVTYETKETINVLFK